MSQSAQTPDELDAALAALDDLSTEGVSLSEHAEAFERVHELLTGRLGEAGQE